MDFFKIEGPVKLKGEIQPQGAKNEALQILAAVLLTQEKVLIKNIPDIIDIRRQISLLEMLGVQVNRLSNNDIEFTASDINLEILESDDFLNLSRNIRGSVLLIGPMLARFQEMVLSKPGGDKIGRRSLDTHLLGLKDLGAFFDFDQTKNLFKLKTKGLKGAYIHLDEPSVTGTGNILMAATLAKGKTTIYNAACEPYIQQLCRMLSCMGAKISGIGTNKLEIEGVDSLGGCEHTCLADMIEVGSFIGLAALTGSEIIIKNAGIKDLGIIPKVFRKLGISFVCNQDDILIPAQGVYEIEKQIDGNIPTIYDAPWPGFTPDLISIALVVATQAKGNVLMHQKMFESRLFFVDNLIDMGAQIILCDPHRATVMGSAKQQHLRGIKMRSPDIRAGVALLLAALSAEGESTIYNIEQIDRGYEQIDKRLNLLGANIQRFTEEIVK
ncbi:MAG: UDP-N-acetylglucosamine 1-carboxyvinyltransferase [Bacteroidetes bacterium]|jgi:UDP-N-acetylglucosamine 1-carboxyvinyltransferase|nr:UDP-N-acetylglucosamine 1-carboxyvinyltransferase [Bacteroidota bacterium]MBT5529796.1 UDP-N-acetylglucosamine 1-carboxyvinyltransferase [Cytophagia bacterium]MBT3422565.1 UDP-N-acetylglucosamine 1-carboxyvinyltransferase [Bacteroidota bacterium]MBT3800489.1 UDP-N-acetylglucosamine 1-carboxyvinyltransferase [Bacteroidota bacterium]MBT3934102.1 UDP-N-acetylglucosamine 1-carboxyvinyltransferase [Bacteroidota bacterium]